MSPTRININIFPFDYHLLPLFIPNTPFFREDLLPLAIECENGMMVAKALKIRGF